MQSQSSLSIFPSRMNRMQSVEVSDKNSQTKSEERNDKTKSTLTKEDILSGSVDSLDYDDMR